MKFIGYPVQVRTDGRSDSKDLLEMDNDAEDESGVDCDTISGKFRSHWMNWLHDKNVLIILLCGLDLQNNLIERSAIQLSESF